MISNENWRAEEDARILSTYLEIIQDKGRLDRASKVAQNQAEQLMKQVNNLKKVAKRGGK